MKRVISVALAAAMMLTGCFASGNGDQSGAEHAASASGAERENGDKQVAGGSTILDLKKKYGSENNKSIMPMYNVAKDEVFTFKFKTKFSNIPAKEIISVHTDVKALEKSEIHTFRNFTDLMELNTVEVKPATGVLASSQTAGGIEKAGWGNAPVYYIRINYDLDTASPTKLKEPIIIPFTVTSALPVPTLKHEIDSNGNFKLVWNPVEGASSYKVYQRSKIALLETVNLPVSGPEEGYIGGFPRLIAEVSKTELNSFLSGATPDSKEEYIISQNQGINGEYYVTAVNGTKESNFSNVISTIKLSSQMPVSLEDKIGFNHYTDISLLPDALKVKFVDGSMGSRPVFYETTGVQIKETGSTNLAFKVEGTALKGVVAVDKLTQNNLKKLSETQGSKSNSGLVTTDNTTEYVPAPNVPTIIDGPSGDGSKRENVVDAQKQNTDKKVNEGNKESVPVPEVAAEIKINADSALEEYLASSMMDGMESISLKAFPEAQNFETIADIMQKVYYQNPLILGLSKYGYDYKSLKLVIKYDYSRSEIKSKQKEIIAEAKKLVPQIIKSGMSDEEKRLAIYGYLNDNTKYDDEALKDAEKNNFQKTDPKFKDSFTTYGIMVKKVGVCASYASVYKMLSDMSKLESVVVTGDMNGVPHAWNKVKIGNEWVHVDSTNNETNSGIPYLLYNSNDATAKALNFSLGKEFWIDQELVRFEAKDNSKDYYVVNGLEVKTATDFGNKVMEQLKKATPVISIRLGAEIPKDDWQKAAVKAFNEVAKDKLQTAKVSGLGTYVIIEP